MLGRYFYVGPAPDGRHFCWSKTPTYECPVAMLATAARVPGSEPGTALRAAAETLGVEVRWLAMRVAGASHGRKRDAQEKLTERCQCGARMKRVGFAYWVERPRTETERQETGARISQALGGGDYVQDGPRRYQVTKREAEAWARRQLQHAKA